MTLVTKIGVFSFAKIYMIIATFIGFLVGIFLWIVEMYSPVMQGPALGAWSIIVFPILYGIIGLVFGALTAFLFNIASGWFGGLEIELKK
jgi:hypothetical protein